MSGDFWTTVGGGSSPSQLPFTGKIGVFFVLMCMTLSNQGNTVETEPNLQPMPHLEKMNTFQH